MKEQAKKTTALALAGVLAFGGGAAIAGTGAFELGGHLQQAQAKTIKAKGQYRFNFDKSFQNRAGCYVKKVKITKTKLTVWGSFKKFKNGTSVKGKKVKSGKYTFKIAKSCVFDDTTAINTLAEVKQTVGRINASKNNGIGAMVTVKSGKVKAMTLLDVDLCWWNA